MYSQAGLNEITILDLTPLADPDSIRVAGTTDNHPARINDLTVDVVPNASSLDDVSDSDDSDSDDEDEDEEPEALKKARISVEKLDADIVAVNERIFSARQELLLLEKYATTVASSTSSHAAPDPNVMKQTLELYNEQRAAHFQATTIYKGELDQLNKNRAKQQKALEKEDKLYRKSMRNKLAERKKRQVERAEKRQEKGETKPEKSTHAHRVRITIELAPSDITAQGKVPTETTTELFQEATLTLTYTTGSASWTPHYDLRLDTTNPSLSSLTYRAHFTNRTYETWSQAAITLSTSQASFGGLKEKIPQMDGWRVTLTKKYNVSDIEVGENGLYSLAEIKVKEEAERKARGIPAFEEAPRDDLLKSIRTVGGSSSMRKRVKSVAAPAAPPPPPARSAPAPYGPPAPSAPAPYGPPAPAQSSYGSPPPGRPIWVQSSRRFEDDSDDDEGDNTTLSAAAKTMEQPLTGIDTYGYVCSFLSCYFMC